MHNSVFDDDRENKMPELANENTVSTEEEEAAGNFSTSLHIIDRKYRNL